jgi:cell division protein FtsL
MSRLNVLLLLALMVSCIYLVRVSYESRRLFAQLDREQSQQHQLETEFGRLQTERQAQATPSRVEKTAREKLGMHSATPAVTQYVAAPVVRAIAGGAAASAGGAR